MLARSEQTRAGSIGSTTCSPRPGTTARGATPATVVYQRKQAPASASPGRIRSTAHRAAGPVHAGAGQPLFHRRSAAGSIVCRSRRQSGIRRVHHRLRHAWRRGPLRRPALLRGGTGAPLGRKVSAITGQASNQHRRATAWVGRCRCCTRHCIHRLAARPPDHDDRRRHSGRHRLGRTSDGAGRRILRRSPAGAGGRDQRLVRNARARLQQPDRPGATICGIGSTNRSIGSETSARWRRGWTMWSRARAAARGAVSAVRTRGGIG